MSTLFKRDNSKPLVSVRQNGFKLLSKGLFLAILVGSPHIGRACDPDNIPNFISTPQKVAPNIILIDYSGDITDQSWNKINAKLNTILGGRIDERISLATKIFPSVGNSDLTPAQKYRIVVNLNGTGGSAEEGLKLALAFSNYFIATRVGEDAYCTSACAIAFLGGTRFSRGNSLLSGNKLPDRTLHINNCNIGFHQPVTALESLWARSIEITKKNPVCKDKMPACLSNAHSMIDIRSCIENMNKTCKRILEQTVDVEYLDTLSGGIQLIRKLISFTERLGINNKFSSLFLSYRGEDVYFVNTKFKANYAGITLDGYEKNRVAANKDNATRVCINRFLAQNISPHLVAAWLQSHPHRRYEMLRLSLQSVARAIKFENKDVAEFESLFLKLLVPLSGDAEFVQKLMISIHTKSLDLIDAEIDAVIKPKRKAIENSDALVSQIIEWSGEKLVLKDVILKAMFFLAQDFNEAAKIIEPNGGTNYYRVKLTGSIPYDCLTNFEDTAPERLFDYVISSADSYLIDDVVQQLDKRKTLPAKEWMALGGEAVLYQHVTDQWKVIP